MPSTRLSKRKKPTLDAVRVQYALGRPCCPFCGADVLVRQEWTWLWKEEAEGWETRAHIARLCCNRGHILHADVRDTPLTRDLLVKLLIEAKIRGPIAP